MKKTILLLLLFISGMAFAQKNSWTVGFNYGTIGSVYAKGKNQDSYRNKYDFTVFVSSFEFTVSYGITNYLAITTGIANTGKGSQIQRRNDPFKNVILDNSQRGNRPFSDYAAIEIPLKLNFRVPLGKSNFYFMGNTGIIFDIMWEGVGSYTGCYYRTYAFNSDYFSNSDYNSIAYPKKINFLVNAGIGFCYRFKCGIGLSLTGDYNIGTRIISEAEYKNWLSPVNSSTIIKYEEATEKYTDKFYSKGDYWKVALGISYTFRQRKDKKMVEQPVSLAKEMGYMMNE